MTPLRVWILATKSSSIERFHTETLMIRLPQGEESSLSIGPLRIVIRHRRELSLFSCAASSCKHILVSTEHLVRYHRFQHRLAIRNLFYFSKRLDLIKWKTFAYNWRNKAGFELEDFIRNALTNLAAKKLKIYGFVIVNVNPNVMW